MADRPIIFSAPMILALLAGRKTQTRRLVPQPPAECGINYMLGEESWLPVEERTPVRRHFEAWTGPLFQNRPAGHLCGSFDITPRFQPRDRLWVRECWSDQDCCEGEAMYRASACDDGLLPEEVAETRWRPSIHMPRWASRLSLIVDSVKVERLQDISEEDALAEGVVMTGKVGCEEEDDFGGTYRALFAHLWNSINGRGAWEANPFVVAISFRVVRSNIDALMQEAA